MEPKEAPATPFADSFLLFFCASVPSSSYEREAIKRWLHEHKTSPRTNLELCHTHVIPNHSLKSAIQEYQAAGSN